MRSNNQIGTDAANSAEELEIRRQEIERREEFLAFRENELAPLREEIGNLRQRYRQVSVGFAFVLAILSVFGIDKLSDVNNRINKLVDDQVKHCVDKAVQPRINESIRFGEELQRALGLAGIPRTTEQAMAIFEQLVSQRRQNELPFSYLTECYLRLDRCYDGYEHLKTFSAKGVLRSEDLEMPRSLRNYGFIMWTQSLYGHSDANEALSLVHRGLTAAERAGDNDELRASAEYMVLIHLAQGDRSHATEFANRYLSNFNPNWKKYIDMKWFAKLKQKHPDIESNLREMFPGSFTAAKTEAGHK